MDELHIFASKRFFVGIIQAGNFHRTFWVGSISLKLYWVRQFYEEVC